MMRPQTRLEGYLSAGALACRRLLRHRQASQPILAWVRRNPITLALGIVLVVPIGIFGIPSAPPPTAQAQGDTFRERFEAVYPAHTFAQRFWPGEGLPFDRKWQVLDVPDPRPVRTIRILPPEPSETVDEITAAEVPLPRARPVHRAGAVHNSGAAVDTAPRNICTRHGMRKVTEGRRWRCRK